MQLYKPRTDYVVKIMDCFITEPEKSFYFINITTNKLFYKYLIRMVYSPTTTEHYLNVAIKSQIKIKQSFYVRSHSCLNIVEYE